MTQLRQRRAVNTGNGDETQVVKEIAEHTGLSDSAVLRAAVRQFALHHYPRIAEKYGIHAVYAPLQPIEVLP